MRNLSCNPQFGQYVQTEAGGRFFHQDDGRLFGVVTLLENGMVRAKTCYGSNTFMDEEKALKKIDSDAWLDAA